MPVIDDKRTLLIRCKCHRHILEISNDDYLLEECGCGPEFEISVWNQTPYPYSFWERLKLIWKLISGENLNGGDIIIDLSDALVISNFLSKKISEWEAKTGKKSTHKNILPVNNVRKLGNG